MKNMNMMQNIDLSMTTTTTTTTTANGRLCNQLFRNIAVSLIAEKCDLKVQYSSADLIRSIGINLFTQGTKTYNRTHELSDDNYIEVYKNANKLIVNLNANNNFFQTKEIGKLIHDYIHAQRVNVIYANPFKDRYLTNNDACLHVRLTDVAIHNPGFDYYAGVLRKINSDYIYIATDEPTHPIIIELITKFPSTRIVQMDPIKTLQFASTCKNVIISHGSFSSTLGYLSFYSTVHYPKIDPKHCWYGNTVTIDGWHEHGDHLLD